MGGASGPAGVSGPARALEPVRALEGFGWFDPRGFLWSSLYEGGLVEASKAEPFCAGQLRPPTEVILIQTGWLTYRV